jgi:TonB family protein
MCTSPSFPVLLFSAVLLATVQAQDSNHLLDLDTTASVPLEVGGNVTAPRPTYTPDPEYCEEARAAGYQGSCVLSLIVDASGNPRDIRVEHSLGMQLDEKAIKALRNWRFEPARKRGKPVAVRINIEVSFHLQRDGKKLPWPEQLSGRGEARPRTESAVYRISQGPGPRTCAASFDQAARPGPVVTIAELNIEGNPRMPLADGIAGSLKQQTYSGTPDEEASEVLERVKIAWINAGFLKTQGQGEAHVLTSSPASEQIAVTVQLDEGPQYRLEGIKFRDNRAITNMKALRSLFPIKDGDVFNRAAIGKGLENLHLAYGQYGYINFTAVPDARFNEESRNVSLDIDMEEGKQFYVNRIGIIGLDESVFRNLTKELLVNPGDVFNQRLVDLFLKNHDSLFPTDASGEPRYTLTQNERTATVAITYDFRACHVD